MKDFIQILKYKNGEALPCPFCGGTEICAEEYEHGAGNRWRVFCSGCMAGIDRGYDQTPRGGLLDAWNRRTGKN